MSLADLKRQGVLLPEEEWGEHRLETTVSEPQLATAFATAVAAVVAMYLGGGKGLTWMGLVASLVALYWIVWVCDRGVLAQRERFRQEREEQSQTEGRE